MTSNDKLMDAFNVTGLTHILSISGTHFGLLSVLLFGMVRLIINVLPYRILQRLTMYLTPSQAAALCCLPLMVIYLCLSGASIPAVRSFLMIGLFLLGPSYKSEGILAQLAPLCCFCDCYLGARSDLVFVFSTLVSCCTLYRFVYPERERRGGERQ